LCPAHVSIKHSEKIDLRAKEASVKEELWNTNLTSNVMKS